MSIQPFEDCCEELLGTPSRNRKQEIVARYITNPVVRQLFRAAIDPTEQYFVRFPEGPTTHSGLALEAVELYLNRLALRIPVSEAQITLEASLRSSRWITRLVNKQLNVGVSAGILNSIVPGLIPDLPIASPEEICFGPDESWQTLAQHISESSKWSIQPAPVGVRCLVEVKYGKIYPRSVTGTPVFNFESLEKELVGMLYASKLDEVALECYLTSSLLDAREAYLKPGDLTPEQEKGLGITILDLISEKPFSQRYAQLTTCPPGLRVQLSPADPALFSTDSQLVRWRELGARKVILRHNGKPYTPGRSPYVFSLRL